MISCFPVLRGAQQLQLCCCQYVSIIYSLKLYCFRLVPLIYDVKMWALNMQDWLYFFWAYWASWVWAGHEDTDTWHEDTNLCRTCDILTRSLVVCPKKYRNQYSHQGRIVQPRAMHGGLCFRLFRKPVLLISWLDAVAVFVKVITKSCSEGVVLALSVASSTSSKWWSCWDKTLVCRKCLTLAGAGWLSPRYPVKLQTKVCKYFTITAA